ncbi:hypothetical protein [Rhizobium sp.]|jgi:hypothetical protein|uniref:hypothetical protein n=1 Tax=Rhizobium sp. TaxID=391 RepID=UPI002AA8369E
MSAEQPCQYRKLSRVPRIAVGKMSNVQCSDQRTILQQLSARNGVVFTGCIVAARLARWLKKTIRWQASVREN